MGTQRVAAGEAPKILRLFTGAGGAEPHDEQRTFTTPTAAWTLDEFYEHWVLPVIRHASGADEKTIAQDWETIELFNASCGRPPLAEIDEVMVARFVANVGARPAKRGGGKVSPNTVRKHCAHLRHLLNLAGPRTPRQPAARSLIEPVYVQPPKERVNDVEGNYSLAELDQILRALDSLAQCRNYQGIPAAQFVDALIRFDYNTGLRIDTVMTATWEMVDRPWPDWLDCPAEIYKGGQHGHKMYLNRHARAAIETLRIHGHARLFPWAGWPKSKSWFYRQWRGLLEAAGLPPHRRFGLYGERRALLTDASEKNAIVARLIGGHRGGGRTKDMIVSHYANRNAMRAYLDALPQPGMGWHQQTLFG